MVLAFKASVGASFLSTSSCGFKRTQDAGPAVWVACLIPPKNVASGIRTGIAEEDAAGVPACA